MIDLDNVNEFLRILREHGVRSAKFDGLEVNFDQTYPADVPDMNEQLRRELEKRGPLGDSPRHISFPGK